MSVARGEFISLLGPSGCGKTTVLRCIAGFERATGGSILLSGEDITKRAPHLRGVGLVFQNYALFPHLTVYGNVSFGLRLRREPAQQVREKVREALEIVGLTGMEERLPSKLSGGQQQRVAIARSLIMRPEILLLDEPLSNLDQKLRIQMRRELKSIQRRTGTTFIYVTHDQGEALTMSDRVVVMSGGKIAQVGPPADVYGRPRSRFVADFVGASNMYSGEVARVLSPSVVEVKCDGGPLLRSSSTEQFQPGDRVCVCIRPERLTTVEEGSGAGSAGSTLCGSVVETSFSGERTEVRVELPQSGNGSGQPFSVAFYATGGCRIGERVSLLLPTEHVLAMREEAP